MTPRRIDAGLAGKAANVIDSLRDHNDDLPKDILPRLRGLAVNLRINGLVATLALYTAKSGSDSLGQAYRKVFDSLWAEIAPVLCSPPSGAASDPFKALCSASPSTLALASHRVELFAVWLSRLAEAVVHDQRAVSMTQGSEDA